MRTPRKIYLVTSKKACKDVTLYEIFLSHTEAKLQAKRRSEIVMYGGDDWRVEVFVKGD